MMLSMLNKIDIELKEVKANQQVMMSQFNSVYGTNRGESFFLKNKLELPFETLEAFHEFDSKLGVEGEFRKDFVNSLF